MGGFCIMVGGVVSCVHCRCVTPILNWAIAFNLLSFGNALSRAKKTSQVYQKKKKLKKTTLLT